VGAACRRLLLRSGSCRIARSRLVKSPASR
jgi:hypothetical protein